MLLGRGRECGVIEQVLAGVSERAASVLVLSGPTGIGKTALLDWAVESSPALQPVVVRGAEGEQHIRWSALREMVRLLEAGFTGLLAWQLEALTGLLDGAPSDPIVVGGALVALFSVNASMRPVLVVVDDVRWIDELSRDALKFAARRIDHEPVAILIAVDDASHDDFTMSFPVLDVSGLSPIDAVTLLAGDVETRVAEQLARITAGNPLAIREIAKQLSPEQCAGTARLGSELPLGEVLLRGFARRTAGLSLEQHRLLVMASAEPGMDPATFRAAASGAGSDPALIDDLITPGLLSAGRDGRLRFAQPLLSDSVYQGASPDERRLVHRALAAVYSDTADDAALARHLAAGADGPDPAAVRALELVAERARARGDAPAAARALASAADLADDRREKMRLLVAAGAAFALGDLNEPAVRALEQALELTVDPREQAEIQIALAGPRLAVSGPPRGYAELAHLADRVERIDSARASSLNTLAALTALAAGDIRTARALCRRALGDAPRGTRRPERMALALSGLLLALSGDRDAAVRELLKLSEPGHEMWVRPTLVFEDLVAEALTWVGEYSAASRLVTALVDRSRETNAIALLARALVVRADLYLRTGYWDAALADAHESVAFAKEISAPASASFALAVMARIEAGIGRAGDAREHGLAALTTAQGLDLAVNAFWAQGALGFLELSAGKGPEAVEYLEAARLFAERESIELVFAVPWAPDLVEAYVRVGRVNDARRLVSEMADRDVEGQGPLAGALLSRCRGLVARRGADEHFRAALAAHAAVLAPFERARSRLVYGEWLRRERRVSESVPNLEAAAAMFADLRATLWHSRATAELDAHGGRSAIAPRRGRSSLTPQEFRVACSVADGATNREAAAALFLSPRTVEHHLENVYRKLGVRSRSELARHVSSDPDFSIRLESVDGDG